jgi:hypothetical protein
MVHERRAAQPTLRLLTNLYKALQHKTSAAMASAILWDFPEHGCCSPRGALPSSGAPTAKEPPDNNLRIIRGDICDFSQSFRSLAIVMENKHEFFAFGKS